MTIPTNDEILAILDQLETSFADDLESEYLDFKRWTDAKSGLKVAIGYAACFANAEGGVVVFGVEDKVHRREKAIHGAKSYTLDTWKCGIFNGTLPHLDVDVEELSVPEGTGKLLIVRIPKGEHPPYGTTAGSYRKRVGKNCIGLHPTEHSNERYTAGIVDWSGEPAVGVEVADLDPVEIARARRFLRARNPDSLLLDLEDGAFLKEIQAVRQGHVTNAGLLLFGRPDIIRDFCHQSQVHYVHQTSDTTVSRNDFWNSGLLQIIENIESIFSSPINPEEEIEVGLTKIRIPAFPLVAVREAVLNAVTHRDYTNPGEVLIRQLPTRLIVTSPGGFIGGITPKNILTHESVQRNRTLANAFVQLRLVESAGVGRSRIFGSMLNYGKRIPQYEADDYQVTLNIYDGTFDRRMASMIAEWTSEGVVIGLSELLVLSYLKDNPYLDTQSAADLLQVSPDQALRILDQMTLSSWGILERKGHTRMATFFLTKKVAKDLIGRANYTRIRGIETTQFPAVVREHLRHHGSINNAEVRELFNLGNSRSASVEASRYLKTWSGEDGFLIREGKPPNTLYRLRDR
ncbi:RNA-binding domain-containing protein [Methanosphaerula subterraneus]|uniref:RNA-binding domain-containing protein n=1 Tax=Methanosphaerula subterraneus TaxID=3350244 RepID=UPI003F85527D